MARSYSITYFKIWFCIVYYNPFQLHKILHIKVRISVTKNWMVADRQTLSSNLLKDTFFFSQNIE